MVDVIIEDAVLKDKGKKDNVCDGDCAKCESIDICRPAVMYSE